MFHPLWEDLGGHASVAKELTKKQHCKLCGTTCELCGHSSVVHRLNGTCHAANCICGWSKDLNGALYVKSTGEYAGEVSRRPGRNNGAKVGPSRRQGLLKIPCYFCGGKAESIDHFIPRAKGGTSAKDNLVSACCACNNMKSDKTYEELLEFCRQIQTRPCLSGSLRRQELHKFHQTQGQKILSWHFERLKSKSQSLPVV